ncbi:MAG TPA: anti-sigma factor domain-containing protein [Pseudobacteroides sp.]|uniref:anti-sigma factor domain-containing protein n=1 Tax=Pseudobacteroides sp. TaxID=1968840 RepID=UPI002F94A8EA
MNYEGIVISLTESKAIVATNDFQCFYIKRVPVFYIGKQVKFSGKNIIRKRSVFQKLLTVVG